MERLGIVEIESFHFGPYSWSEAVRLEEVVNAQAGTAVALALPLWDLERQQGVSRYALAMAGVGSQ